MADFWDPLPEGNGGILQPDDPLRAWGDNLTRQEVSHLAAGNDPQAAIDRLIARGVPPPPSQIMSFAPVGWENGKSDFEPTGAAPEAKGFSLPNLPSLPSLPKYSGPTGPDGFPVFKGGKLQGNLTSEQGVPPATEAPATIPLPQSDPRKALAAAPIAAPASFDPEPEGESVPLPRARPAEAGPGASDISAQAKKKPSVGDALGDFSKSLSGVKAPTAPPLNAVGTPGAPQHSAMPATNISQLLSLIGQQQRPSALQTLGRLLVAGKA